MAEMAREWLIRNGYPEVAEQIDAIMNGWREKGTKTRRNWWQVIAGNISGSPRIIEGYTFPIIKAARDRMGYPETENAISNSKREEAPLPESQVRWKGKKKKKKK